MGDDASGLNGFEDLQHTENKRTVRFADEGLAPHQDSSRRAVGAFGGAPSSARRDDPASKSTAPSQATLSAEVALQFVKARSQPKKKGHEQRETTEI